MTKNEKTEFIKEFSSAVVGELLEKVDLIPEEWDGLELRYLLASKFEGEKWGLSEKRRRGFDSQMATSSL